MEIKQGDIFWVSLDPIKGHEQSGERPVLVLQNDLLNPHLSTVVIAPITTNLATKGLFTTCFIEKDTTRLRKDSIVLLYQLRAVDKVRFKKKIGQISPDKMNEIKFQMALLF
ncbi:MAG: type II toxin-antitoxin system PemK/MazF family toxin [Candidatus Gracilibacteria bacterium]